MDQAKAGAIASGKSIIDLSLGSSDLPAPAHVLEAIATALQDPATHGYALFHSTQPFRRAVAQWYERKWAGAGRSEEPRDRSMIDLPDAIA
ncbi:MAG: hypothetical protein AAFV92_14720, partial [Pseudomonadota bacterium]